MPAKLQKDRPADKCTKKTLRNRQLGDHKGAGQQADRDERTDKLTEKQTDRKTIGQTD